MAQLIDLPTWTRTTRKSHAADLPPAAVRELEFFADCNEWGSAAFLLASVLLEAGNATPAECAEIVSMVEAGQFAPYRTDAVLRAAQASRAA